MNDRAWMTLLERRGLSPREVEVANTVCGGLTNIKAAEKLEIGEKTIKFHLTSIYVKLGVRSRAEMMALKMK